MRDINWDGLTTEASVGADTSRIRHVLADAAKSYRWDLMLSLIGENAEMVNSTRPGSVSLFAPLHQAAHGNAPVEIVQRLVELGAWRFLADADGETPLDIAIRRGHGKLFEPLRPRPIFDIPRADLVSIQSRFHEVIMGRAARDVIACELRLPQLAPVLEIESAKWWLAVPGMAGGFAYWMETRDGAVRLVSESWCRLVDGVNAK